MYINIVTFRATYEDGISIDGLIQEEWSVQHNTWLLMQQFDDHDERMRIYNSMPPVELSIANKVSNATRHMELRAQINGPNMKGPYTFHTEEPLTERFLLDWAEANVFNRNRNRNRKEKDHA